MATEGIQADTVGDLLHVLDNPYFGWVRIDGDNGIPTEPGVIKYRHITTHSLITLVANGPEQPLGHHVYYYSLRPLLHEATQADDIILTPIPRIKDIHALWEAYASRPGFEETEAYRTALAQGETVFPRIVVEELETGFSCYSPDVPFCIATRLGTTYRDRQIALANMLISLHAHMIQFLLEYYAGGQMVWYNPNMHGGNVYNNN